MIDFLYVNCRSDLRWVGLAALMFSLAACGGGGGNGSPSAAALIATTLEPAGAACPSGGTRVQAGQDTNGDGVLQPAEVSNTSYVCNAPASPGSVLVATSGLEPGKAVSLIFNSGAPVLIASNGFVTLSSGLAAGTAFTVTIAAQPASGQTCSLSAPTGTVATGAVATVSLSCADNPKFAYVANYLSNNVSAYSINSATGLLTAVAGSPFVAGTNPTAAAVDPKGKFVYVANASSSNVSAFNINAATGVLTAVAGSPFAAGNEPRAVTVDPDGKFAYVSTFSEIAAFAIDPVTGALTSVASSPFAATSNPDPQGIAIDPSGNFAFVANGNNNNLLNLIINQTTGALTFPAGPVPSTTLAGSYPISTVVDPSGRFVYVANLAANSVSALRINTSPANGGFTAPPGVPVAAGTTPATVTVEPGGKYAYTANRGSNNVSAYSIDLVTGALKTLLGSPFAAGTSPNSIKVDSSGKFAYTANGTSNNVSAFNINPGTGALTAAGTFAAGTGPSAIVISQRP